MLHPRIALPLLLVIATSFSSTTNLSDHIVTSGSDLSAANAPLVFTFQGEATGNIQAADGAKTSFTKSLFTITAYADPSEIKMRKQTCAVPSGSCTLLDIPVQSATISVSGKLVKIISPLGIFDNQTYKTLGLTRQPAGGDLLDLQFHPVFADYGLNHSLEIKDVFFKDLTPLGQFNCAKECVMTEQGALNIDSVQNVRVKVDQTQK